LVRARDQLDVGRRTSNAAALNDARSLTKDATTRLKQVADEVVHLEHEAMQHQLADAAARSHEAFSLVDGAFANLDRLSSQRPSTGAPDLSAKEDALQLQVASARRRLETAINGESLSGIVDAGRQAANITAQLNELISSFGPLTLADRGVHPALINGAKLYFAGQYKEALATLSPEGGFAPDVPLQLHVHLFKAAAAYALFLLSGATNDALRQQALAEIGECKRLDTSFEPDARAFTPRFIAVFHSGQIAPSKTAVARSQ
jgi:hypothetical protein